MTVMEFCAKLLRILGSPVYIHDIYMYFNYSFLCLWPVEAIIKVYLKIMKTNGYLAINNNNNNKWIAFI